VYPVTPRAAAAGFTLVELLVALTILSLLLVVGVPRMSDWLLINKATGATEFYAEGFQLARAEAVKHNSASRILLTANAANGQFDWQVDICFPTVSVPCDAASGAWSTTAANATGDPEGAAGFKSVFRSAAGLPASSVLAQSLSPLDATGIYYTPLGWVDTAFSTRLTRITLAPASGRAGAFPTSAVVVTLAGVASKCNPNAVAHDSRGCPP
jgi:type IV fimbrial biogenesis protein FimT